MLTIALRLMHYGHDLRVDWSTMYGHDTEYRVYEGWLSLVVDTMSYKALDGGGSDTEIWCKTCDRDITGDIPAEVWDTLEYV